MGRLIVDGRSCNVLRVLVEHARLAGVEVLVLSHFGLKLYEKHPGAFYDILAIARKRGLPVCAAYNEIMHVEKQLLLSDPTSGDDAVAGFWVELSPQPHEKDSADRWVLERVVAGDVVLTTDVPLMWSCLERGAAVIDRLGCSYEPDDLGYFRNVDQMRASHSVLRFSCKGSPSATRAPLLFLTDS